MGKEVIISDFYCTECGHRGIPLPRDKSKIREGGHLKKLYCMYCQKQVNHVEIRPFGKYTYEDFIREFNSGKFEKGKRIK